MTSQAETFSRNRRLYDVRRGVVYLRRTDDLANNQWRHFGTVPDIKTHVIRDIGITTRLSDVTGMESQGDTSDDKHLTDSGSSPHDVRAGVRATDAASAGGGDAGQPREKFVYKTRVLEECSSARPQISVTEVTDRQSGASAEPQPVNEHAPLVVSSPLGDSNNVSMASSASVAGTTSMTWSEAGAGPQDLNRETRPFSLLSEQHQQQHPVSKDIQHSLREAPYTYGPPYHHAESGSASAFDTWGSRNWKVEEKLEPDPFPKSYAPKHYLPMSRAAGAGLGQKGARPRRQLKTLTDFRSRNGTLRIIRSPAPIPGTKSHRQRRHQDDDNDSDEEFDVSTLGREKTYAMLKRIDRLLEPNKAFFVSDLTSSVREVRSSSPSSLSDLEDSLPGSDLENQHVPPPPGRKPQQAEGHVRVHNEDDFLKHFRRGPGDQLHPLGERVQERGELVQLGADRDSSVPPGRLGELWPGAEGLSHSQNGGFRQSTNAGGREIIREQHNPRLEAQVRRFLYGQPERPGKTTGGESFRQHRDDGGEPPSTSLTTEVSHHHHHHYRPTGEASSPQRAGSEVSRPRHLPPLQRELVGRGREDRPLLSQRGQSTNNHTYSHPHHRETSSDYTYPQRQPVNHRGHPQHGQVSSDYTYPQQQPKNHDQGHRQIHKSLCSEHDQHEGDRRAVRGGKGEGMGKGKGKAREVEAGWLSGLVEGLESGVDMFAKCQDWVSKSFADHSPRPAV